MTLRRGPIARLPAILGETLLIVTVAQLSGLLWLIGSPVPGLKELPEASE